MKTVQEAAEHLLSSKFINNDNGYLPSKLAHPPKQPRRHFAIVKWQIGNPGSLS